MKLEVGMYVRVKGYFGHTHIFKIVKVKGDEIYSFYKDENNLSYCLKEDVLKASHNIIDLIEVGDYVNGCYVDEIISDNDSWDDRKHFHLLKFISYFSEEDIKSIVTKEQFESMQYKV